VIGLLIIYLLCICCNSFFRIWTNTLKSVKKSPYINATLFRHKNNFNLLQITPSSPLAIFRLGATCFADVPFFFFSNAPFMHLTTHPHLHPRPCGMAVRRSATMWNYSQNCKLQLLLRKFAIFKLRGLQIREWVNYHYLAVHYHLSMVNYHLRTRILLHLSSAVWWKTVSFHR
jgi:hypothetical protein